jgi:hypothetical protein
MQERDPEEHEALGGGELREDRREAPKRLKNTLEEATNHARRT